MIDKLEKNQYTPYCELCMKEINQKELHSTLQITLGYMKEDRFISKSYPKHYHITCLENFDKFRTKKLVIKCEGM